mgnify:CR=1 FL=1
MIDALADAVPWIIAGGLFICGMTWLDEKGIL